jgi:hypothetical protein
MTGVTATGPTSLGKCALEPEVATADSTSSGRRALEPGVAAIGGEPSPEEPAPAKTRDGKHYPMGSSMTLNSERKSKSDDEIGSNFSAKGKEDSSNET